MATKTVSWRFGAPPAALLLAIACAPSPIGFTDAGARSDAGPAELADAGPATSGDAAAPQDAAVRDAATDDAATQRDAGMERPVDDPVFSAEFTSGRTGWLCTHGEWSVAGGALVGVQPEGLEHDAACLTNREPLDLRRARVEARFRFEGDELSIRMNYWDYPETSQHHHLVKVGVRRDGTVQLFTQSGWGGRPLRSTSRRVAEGHAPAGFVPSEWSVARIEAQDGHIRVSVDGELVLEGDVDAMPVSGVDTPRNSVSLATQGTARPAEVDYVRVWRLD